MSRETLEDALWRWGSSERNALDQGYPSVAAGFQDYSSGYRAHSRVPTLSELDIQGLVERGIGCLFADPNRNPEYCALVVYYWASPADPPDKKERIDRACERTKRREFFRRLERARTYLQGVVDVYTRDH